jgi:hypothetical protein
MPDADNDGIGLGSGNRSATHNDLVVGYSPTDFFYQKAEKQYNRNQYNFSTDPITCGNLDPYNDDLWAPLCGFDNIYDNSANCIQKELCKNKDAADQLTKTQSVTTGTDVKYQDVKMQHNSELMFSVNLGIGIIFVAGLIYQNVA